MLGPREKFRPSSVADAWSSKSKVRQMRFRRAMPQARLIAVPKGAWITSCMPPLSSKNRSATIRFRVGTKPKTFLPGPCPTAETPQYPDARRSLTNRRKLFTVNMLARFVDSKRGVSWPDFRSKRPESRASRSACERPARTN